MSNHKRHPRETQMSLMVLRTRNNWQMLMFSNPAKSDKLHPTLLSKGALNAVVGLFFAAEYAMANLYCEGA